MGKLLIIKGADFSKVAVGKITPSPTEITYYDFIHFDGNSYVTTNVTTKTNTKVETAAVVETWLNVNSYAHILGTRTASLSSNDKFVVQMSDKYSGVSAAIGNMDDYSQGIKANLGTKYIISADSKKFLVNGQTFTTGGVITPGTYPFFLGNTNSGGSPLTGGQYFIGKLYETKFYEGETLVADFKPCTKEGVVGFYDIIGQKFYGNSGAGTLTAWND